MLITDSHDHSARVPTGRGAYIVPCPCCQASTGFMAVLAALHVCLRVSAFGFGLLNASCARYYGKCMPPEEYYTRSTNTVHMWEREKTWLRSTPDARLTLFS